MVSYVQIFKYNQFLKSLSSFEYKINKLKHHIIIKYVQICCSCCTNEDCITKSGNNLEIMEICSLKKLVRSRSLMFQLSETSSGKLIFSSLVMLSTMEERRRRLEEAGVSLAPGKRNKKTYDCTRLLLLCYCVCSACV